MKLVDDGPTDGPTDRPTDMGTYRAAIAAKNVNDVGEIDIDYLYLQSRSKENNLRISCAKQFEVLQDANYNWWNGCAIGREISRCGSISSS